MISHSPSADSYVFHEKPVFSIKPFCYLLIFLAGFLFSSSPACHAQTPTGRSTPAVASFPFEPLFSTRSGSHQRGNMVIRNALEYERVFYAVMKDAAVKPDLPPVNFSKSMVVAILLGDQLAEGRFINIVRIVQAGAADSRITVEYTVATGRSVNADGIRVTVPTQPSAFYIMPLNRALVVFKNTGAQDEGRESLEEFKDPQAGDAGGRLTGQFSDLAAAHRSVRQSDKVAIVKGEADGLRFLAGATGQNRVALNIAFVLMAACLAWASHLGFVLMHGGLSRAGNNLFALVSYFAVVLIAIVGFWATGWALMWGAHGPVSALGGIGPITEPASWNIPGLGSLAARSGFFLAGNSYDVGVGALWILQAALAALAVALPLGAWLERVKFSVLFAWSFCASCLIYPVFGHWVWGNGWLATLGQKGLGVGFIDFAGSGVIHAFSGICALAGLLVLGPRRSTPTREDEASTAKIQPHNSLPHNLVMVGQGALIVGICWTGLTLGAMRGVAGEGALRVGLIAAATFIAGAGGALASLFFSLMLTRRVNLLALTNGLLAGLVAISAGVAFVSPSVALVIGAVGGLIGTLVAPLLAARGLDDPAHVVATHGAAGIWGLLAVGIFADGTFGAGWNNTVINRQPVPIVSVLSGGFSQLAAQSIGILALCIWCFLSTWLFFKVAQKLFHGLRADENNDALHLDSALLRYNPGEKERSVASFPLPQMDLPVQRNTEPEFDPFSEPPLTSQ